EGAPVIILEALASGVPVVASDVGAIREYASTGCDLVATEPRRSEAERLAGAVQSRLVRGGIPQFDAAYFNMSRVAAEYFAVFRSVCSAGDRRPDQS
ncbi:MAG TPA: glycosyltransferase, partial [Desulfuromonadaceae bacterium]